METRPHFSNQNLLEIPKLSDYSMAGSFLPALGDADFQMGHC